MLLFKEFLDLKSVIRDIKKTSLGISRHKMPQVFSDHFDKFKLFLKAKNISHKVITIKPEDYKATQNQFNDEKIMKMFRSLDQISNKKSNPILVSKDKYVVDGHHRWIANYINNTTKTRSQHTMQALEINMSIKELLDVMNTFEHVGFKKVSEGILYHDSSTIEESNDMHS